MSGFSDPLVERSALVRLTVSEMDGLLDKLPNDGLEDEPTEAGIRKLRFELDRARRPALTPRFRGDPPDPAAQAATDQHHAEAVEMLREAVGRGGHFFVAVAEEDGTVSMSAGGVPSSMSPAAFFLNVEDGARRARFDVADAAMGEDVGS